jgi:hypothetical protein
VSYLLASTLPRAVRKRSCSSLQSVSELLAGWDGAFDPLKGPLNDPLEGPVWGTAEHCMCYDSSFLLSYSAAGGTIPVMSGVLRKSY